ncbi:ornithine aminotransferase [Ilyonectria robusta]|uniref:ornithine aminotransferase n=1 Tax=Ilyonectria robusta TaxID=1079257 RepID=UPI001E8CBECB|nr:ornithine aminotransferase [Ilyonectria robusta]KAH8659020.1 ornithine aminotransferase [Ilyonectria robusta]
MAPNDLTSKRSLPLPESARTLDQLNKRYSVGGINSLPVYLASGEGSRLKDTDGRELIDFICGFSASNLGQRHPRILEAQINTAKQITLANIAGQAAGWPILAKQLCEKFGYDRVTAMTTGSEATDTACKLARGWGVSVKKIDPSNVLVLGTSENYHGTLSGVWPLMEPEAGWEEFATFSKNMTNINPKTGKVLRYLHAEDYAEVFEQMHERIAAVIMEPLHGLARSMDEEISFCIKVRKLCKEYNILFIADEVRMGSCKTGKFLSSDWMGPENKPDMVTLGKSISGGAYPTSYVLGPNEVMSKMKPYHSVSTFSMSAMAVAAVQAALRVYEEENLQQRARDIQQKWVTETSTWNFPYLRYAPGFGADLNLLLDEEYQRRPENISPRRLSLLCVSKGLLVFPGPHGRVRLGVALTISDEALLKGFEILREALEELPLYGDIEGSEETAGAF